MGARAQSARTGRGPSVCRAATLVFVSTTFSLGFAIALLAFVGMHWDMVARNYTSIESIDFSCAASWPHDRGARRNFTEVFGRRRAPSRSPHSHKRFVYTTSHAPSLCTV